MQEFFESDQVFIGLCVFALAIALLIIRECFRQEYKVPAKVVRHVPDFPESIASLAPGEQKAMKYEDDEDRLFDMFDGSHGMDFSAALCWLKIGQKIARREWRGFWLAMADNEAGLPMIYRMDASGREFVWFPSQSDILGGDWKVL